MIRHLDRAWRVVATGLSFFCFGVGGLCLRVLIFPLLQLLVRDPLRRKRLARQMVQASFRFFIGLMRAMRVLTYEVRGLERLQRGGQLILANHPTLLDVVFLVSLVPNADCVVRGGLARNAFTRGPIQAAGYISNDSGLGLVEDCIASVRRGGNLIIFPEGTRTPRDGREIRLQRGAANIAVRGRLDVTPIRIQCEPPTLSKGEKWYRVPPRRMHFTISVDSDLAVDQIIGHGSSEAIAARRMTEYLYDYFFKESSTHAGA
ncbi:lysophospholipid acyltransferase family protein [Solimonas sp. K1W22B-7]|uniref:lysophospholipid acyltransferase family protein n=1 Tax=Solimonas sp. K1W22B-7 TaxID=2303331 RepID=UPI0019695101|nr:lysophospholipid acyltransferase family protein [Solimonas sp. K1W22B-7]